VSGGLDILIEEFEGSLWVAALDQGRLQGFEIDPYNEEVRWGSIYWAKVKSIDASMDAVYVDLDGYNTGILYNKDVRIKNKDGTYEKGGTKAIGKLFSAGDMLAVQAKSAYLPDEFEDHKSAESKIPRVSMDITLQGRYLIFASTMPENRLSQRIRDKDMRRQLEKMMGEMKDFCGFILRAAATNTQTDILFREAKILKAAWEQMSAMLNGSEPQLIMSGPDAIQRTLSDHAGELIDTIEVVTMDHYDAAEEWCSIFAPDLVTKIEPLEIPGAEDDLALFHYRDIVGQIDDLSESYKLLPSGGNIILQETSALTAIDVNKGGDKNGYLAINLEAAEEAMRQIRLRNLGGMLLIDFLRMKNKKEYDALLDILKKAAENDPCTVQIHGQTNLGLIEISRNRRTPSLQDRLKGFVFQ